MVLSIDIQRMFRFRPLQQDESELGLVQVDADLKRSEAGLLLGKVHVGAGLEEVHRHFLVSEFARPMQRCNSQWQSIQNRTQI
jgi:hypothetical protein